MATLLRDHPELKMFQLQNVRLTGKRIGSGSYGSVEEGEIPGAACAVKKIHDIFLDYSAIPPAEIQRAAGQFVEECRLMTTLRHPHIVLFLGLCVLPGSRLPALVMERLLTSLHDLLETRPNIPLGLKHSFLYDVAQGLCYLHSRSPPLIHRDLSARNVLLNSAMTAKIADLGMARIVPTLRAATMTQAPGASIYMPPEALEDKSRYDMSIDIFSLGVVVIFTLTQRFPQKVLAQVYRDEGHKQVIRDELERRGEYMQQIYSQFRDDHPLVQMIKLCLKSFPEDRPTIRQVVQLLKQARAEIDDAECRMDRITLVQRVKDLTSSVFSKDQEIELLRHQTRLMQTDNTQLVQELIQQNHELTRQNRKLKEESQSQKAGIEQPRKHVSTGYSPVISRGQLQAHAQPTDRSTSPKMSPAKTGLASRSPMMSRGQLQAQVQPTNRSTSPKLSPAKPGSTTQRHLPKVSSATEVQDDMQITRKRLPKSTSEGNFQVGVQSAQMQRDKYNTLPVVMKVTPLSPQIQQLRWPLRLKWRKGRDLPFGVRWAHAVVLHGHVYIGGGKASDESNEYIIIRYDPRSGGCSKLPRNTARYFAMAVVSSRLLLAGGGDKNSSTIQYLDDDCHHWIANRYPRMPTGRSSAAAVGYKKYLIVVGGDYTDKIEVLDCSNSQWYRACSLPMGGDYMTAVISSGRIYISSCYWSDDQPHVFSAYLPTLILTATSSATTTTAASMWQELPSPPVHGLMLLDLQNHLLLVGGDYEGRRKEFYRYDSEKKSWSVCGHLPIEMWAPTCTILPSGELFVAGGWVEGVGKYSQQVWIGSFE